jgi:hypothetical protein
MSTSSPADAPPVLVPRSQSIEDLYFPTEKPWRLLYPWLENNGYLLRSRYAPDWVPSWKGTNKDQWECEDNMPMRVRHSLVQQPFISL